MQYIKLNNSNDSTYSHTVELDDTGLYLADYDTNGQLMGIEILEASTPSSDEEIAEMEALLKNITIDDITIEE